MYRESDRLKTTCTSMRTASIDIIFHVCLPVSSARISSGVAAHSSSSKDIPDVALASQIRHQQREKQSFCPVLYSLLARSGLDLTPPSILPTKF